MSCFLFEQNLNFCIKNHLFDWPNWINKTKTICDNLGEGASFSKINLTFYSNCNLVLFSLSLCTQLIQFNSSDIANKGYKLHDALKWNNVEIVFLAQRRFQKFEHAKNYQVTETNLIKIRRNSMDMCLKMIDHRQIWIKLMKSIH